jgi:type II secretory pathway pseudopilin PulG
MDALHEQLTPPKTKGRDGSPSGPKPQATKSPFPKDEGRLRRKFRTARRAIPTFLFRSEPSGAQRPSNTRQSPLANRYGGSAAFTLIESVVAIGIFAFVIVGIVGLFGSTLQRQRQASFETRAVMISQQILSRIRAAESAANVLVTRGTDTDNLGEQKLFHSANLTTSATNTLVFYYKKDGTEISGLLATNNYASDTFSFFPDYDPDGSPQDIVGRARATLTTNGTGSTNLYRVTIDVSEPANLPLSARRYTNTFTTFATFPN